MDLTSKELWHIRGEFVPFIKAEICASDLRRDRGDTVVWETLNLHTVISNPIFQCSFCLPFMKGLKNKSIDSLYCSSPQKSLVKGERFMCCEEKPEQPETSVVVETIVLSNIFV